MENFISRIGLEEVAEQAAETTQDGGFLGGMGGIMSMFMIIIGVFIMYSAITGKGPAYKNDYPEAMQEAHTKMLRTFCWIVGPIVLATGILDYMGYTIVFWITTGVILAAVVVYIILFRRKFKEYL